LKQALGLTDSARQAHLNTTITIQLNEPGRLVNVFFNINDGLACVLNNSYNSFCMGPLLLALAALLGLQFPNVGRLPNGLELRMS